MPHDELVELVFKSKTFKDILDVFGMSNKGGNSKTLKRRLTEENINYTHIRQGMDSNKGRKFPDSCMSKEECLSNIFVNPSSPCKSSIKRYLIKYNLIPYECECGLKNVWRNKKLSLQLDHKDGNGSNNSLENLRWLCPNCHSQTETFAGKKLKIKYFCEKCQSEIAGYGKICYSCLGLRRRKVKRPTKEELKRLTETMPMVKIGKRFGVSDNAVKKWIKSYEEIDG